MPKSYLFWWNVDCANKRWKCTKLGIERGSSPSRGDVLFIELNPIIKADTVHLSFWCQGRPYKIISSGVLSSFSSIVKASEREGKDPGLILNWWTFFFLLVSNYSIFHLNFWSKYYCRYMYSFSKSHFTKSW